MARSLKWEEVKRRWTSEPVLVTFPGRNSHGKKVRRNEDVKKLMQLAEFYFKARFEIRDNKLVFKSMYEIERQRREMSNALASPRRVRAPALGSG